jgi:hypothetical protein
MVAVHCGHVDVPDVHCLRVKVTVDGPIAAGAFSGHSFFTTAPDGNWPASLGSAPNQFVLGQERSTTLRCVPSTIFAMSLKCCGNQALRPLVRTKTFALSTCSRCSRQPKTSNTYVSVPPVSLSS